MALIYAYKNRGKSFDIVINGTSGVIIPGMNDIVRIVIGRESEMGANLSGAKLVVTSAGSTGNGSSITKATDETGKNRVRLDDADLSFDPGTYILYVDYFDNADASEWKNVDRQVFHLEQS